MDARMAHHIVGEQLIQWRQCQRRILHDLYRCAAGTKHDERAKCAIHAHADNQLVRVTPLDHGRHREPVHPGIRLQCPDLMEHVGRRGLGRCRGCEVEAHAADIRFMADVAG